MWRLIDGGHPLLESALSYVNKKGKEPIMRTSGKESRSGKHPRVNEIIVDLPTLVVLLIIDSDIRVLK